ncbi:glycosyltransferase [Candidatus Gracilibacteria bacterium]|nr:glycosyltransferase [Candidatus Gracilibacteria bacterium]
MKKNIFISIIVATYNSESTVQDTIDSLLSQTYTNFEVIVQDGESSDDTINIVRSYKDNRLKLFVEKDNGIYDAMNKGIHNATGDIIGILNSDDFYADNEVLQDVVQLFDSENIEAVYADLRYVQPIDTTKIVRNWKAGEMSDRKWINGWMPPHPTFFVRRVVYEKYGTFNLSLKTSADYELMLRLLYKKKINCGYIPRCIVNMRTGGQSNLNIKNRLKANKEDKKAWFINDINSKWYTIYLKPIRKIRQYLLK